MKTKIILLGLFIGSVAVAATPRRGEKVSLTGDAALQIQPIVGYETSYRDKPSAHTTKTFIYGGRISYGTPALSGELEYTKGKSTEDFDVDPTKVITDEEKLKLGIRSSYHLTDFFFVTGRLGGQASRGTVKETNSGVVTDEDIPLKVYPYAGAGLGVHLGQFLTLSASSTLVVKSGNDMTKNDIQNVIAFSVGIN